MYICICVCKHANRSACQEVRVLSPLICMLIVTQNVVLRNGTESGRQALEFFQRDEQVTAL